MTLYEKTPAEGNVRQTPCDSCGSDLIEMKHTKKVMCNNSKGEMYEERCVNCGNLLYGWIKKNK